jgi:hypothetical protein
MCTLLGRTFRAKTARWRYGHHTDQPVTSGRLGEVQTRIVTALRGIGADPDQMPAADVIDLCAIIALRHIGEAAEIAQAWLGLQHLQLVQGIQDLASGGDVEPRPGSVWLLDPGDRAGTAGGRRTRRPPRGRPTGVGLTS